MDHQSNHLQAFRGQRRDKHISGSAQEQEERALPD